MPHDAVQSRYVNPTNACQCMPKLPAPPIHLCFWRVRRCQTAPALPTKWQPVGPQSCWGSAVSHACSPATLAAVTCLWSGWCPTMLPRAVTSTQPMHANACQSFQPHPSTFAFSGFEGAKRHRLCRPSGNPLGLNPAGVLLFRMRAHRRGWRL